jgi:hypothetical protein
LRNKIGRQLWRSDHVAGQSRFEAKTPQSRARLGRSWIIVDAGERGVGGHRPAGGGHDNAQEITLAEEDMSGVSLATFHVFDKENAAKPQRGPRLAMAAGGCGGCGCGGCGCWTGTYYTSPVIGGDGGYDPPARPIRPAHRYTRPAKRTGQ